MARDNARAVPQPVLERAAHDIDLPSPRPPVLEAAPHDIPRPVVEPAAHEMAEPAPPPVHESRAGWILLAAVSAAAAWAVGWVAGVSWAWRAMTPRYLRRTHRRRGASLSASLGLGE